MKKVSLLLFLITLMGFSSFAIGQTVTAYDTTTVYDIEYVSPESLAVGQDDSFFNGDTVVFEAIIGTGPRSLWAGARWSLIAYGDGGGPWNAVQVIQHDTMKSATNMTALKPGYRVRFTASELNVTGEREGLISHLLSNITLPFLNLGVWLSQGLRRLNFLIVAMDFLIEAPLKSMIAVFFESDASADRLSAACFGCFFFC